MTKRMSGPERREQLLGVARSVFAEKGYEATTIEEIADRAKVTKPLVYQHFGGKEGIYAVVVDREVTELTTRLASAFEAESMRGVAEAAAAQFLEYIDEREDGFRILVRDKPAGVETGTFGGVISDVATRVERLLRAEFKKRDYEARTAPLYARMLVGAVAMIGEWWIDERKPSREVVAAHAVNLMWNGLKDLDADPQPIRRLKAV